MSSELSASETTPLRRPGNQSSETSPTATRKVNVNTTTTPRLSLHGSSSTNNLYYRNNFNSSCTPSSTANTVVSIANYNNNIEIRLNAGSDPMRMDTNKRILYRIALDVLLLLMVGFPILGFYLWGSPYHRGFFCDDESLKYPFHDSTVRNWMLYIIGLIIPIGIMLAVEISISNKNAKNASGNPSTSTGYILMDWEVPDWLVECYKKIGIFAFGAALSQMTTDIAKYTIGRLRPHFFAVCQPMMLDGTTCTDPVNVGKYIEDFTCLGVNSTPRMLKEVRLSFPSGHSSFSFFTMVYVALYLQSRMRWRGSKLVRHILQFLLIMIAWYTALSRVSDYKHHWSDVLAGASIGSLCAIIVTNYISDLFEGNSSKSLLLPTTRQDMHITTVNGH